MSKGRGRFSSRRDDAGFTLVELLAVLAVIAILAAIAVINLQVALDKSRQRKTMATMRTIGTAVQSYDADLSRFPSNGITASELSQALSNVTYKHVETQDAWGSDLIYATDQSSYTLESYARDTVDGPQDITRATSDEYDYDIVFVDGQFINSPE